RGRRRGTQPRRRQSPRTHPVTARSGPRPSDVSLSFARLPQDRQTRLHRLARTTVSESDPIIRQLREQISDNDRRLMEALNKRLELVARLKRYKESLGIGFVDPEREEWMLQYLHRANRGPMSAEGLREFFTRILELTKREVS